MSRACARALIAMVLVSSSIWSLGGATATAAASTLPTAVPPPQDDPFYEAPSPIPDVPPGTVIRSRKVDLQLIGVTVPLNAWQLIYTSTDEAGEPAVVSGTLVVPLTPWLGPGPRPIVSYGVGTSGLAPQCTPSYLLASGQAPTEVIFLQELMLQGWAVVISDYLGRGVGPVEHYMSGAGYAHAVLDAARAAQSARDAGLSSGGPVALWGASEGAAAVGWASELHATYAPDLDVVGAADVAVPPDLNALTRHLDGGAFVGFDLLVLAGLRAAYPDGLGLDPILDPAGQDALAFAETHCSQAVIDQFANRSLDEFTTVENPLEHPPVAATLSQNSLGGHVPDVPVMLVAGTNDELIPFATAERLRDTYCQAGVEVSWRPVPLGTHATTGLIGSQAALVWTGQRFAGRPPPDDC